MGPEWLPASVLAVSIRKCQGTGDASDSLSKDGVTQPQANSTATGAVHRYIPNDGFPHWFFAAQGEVGADSLVSYSLLAEKALLSLKICDPACGSRHFLIAAAHRVAKRLAAIRAGEDEPAPESMQHALRDVIGHCIYGVDLNPMAVELCKVRLWIETLEPGKPLSFLEDHIQCGNCLLGTTPAFLKRGICDEAFKHIEGDDKAVCQELKKCNQEEYKGQGLLMFETLPWLHPGNLVQSFANLSDEDDSTPEALAAKEQHYIDLVRSTPYENATLTADAWCAAFVCEKRVNAPLEITEAIFRRWEKNPHHLGIEEREELRTLRNQYKFFHWHLTFP